MDAFLGKIGGAQGFWKRRQRGQRPHRQLPGRPGDLAVPLTLFSLATMAGNVAFQNAFESHGFADGKTVEA